MNDKSMILIYMFILVCRFQNDQDQSVILAMRAAISNPKWPTLKMCTYHIIFKKVDRNAF